jgi:hypothetical protein
LKRRPRSTSRCARCEIPTHFLPPILFCGASLERAPRANWNAGRSTGVLGEPTPRICYGKAPAKFPHLAQPNNLDQRQSARVIRRELIANLLRKLVLDKNKRR